MLSMAAEYLCEYHFRKMENIEKNIEIVKNHFEVLKKQFVGKPVAEVHLKEPVHALPDLQGVYKRRATAPGRNVPRVSWARNSMKELKH